MDRRDFILGSSGVLAGSGLTLSYNYLTSNNKNSSGNDEQDISINIDSSPKIGSNKADVKLIYWVDFQCPYCYRFSNNQFPQIKENYIDEDNVQLILKPLTIFGEDSQKAAISMHCVNNNQKEAVLEWYKTLHNMYNNATGRNSGWASNSNLLDKINDINQINSSNIEDCLSSQNYLDQLRSDYQEGEQYGLSGTPFFVLYNINKTNDYTTINGAQRYDLFRSKIENIL